MALMGISFKKQKKTLFRKKNMMLFRKQTSTLFRKQNWTLFRKQTNRRYFGHHKGCYIGSKKRHFLRRFKFCPWRVPFSV